MQPIRRRIVEILKEQNNATVAELAEQLEMAQVSVRHHLDILVGEDLVQMAGLRRRDGAGRPSQVYELTAGAAKLFPQRHDALANEILTQVKTVLSPADFRAMLSRMADRLVEGAPLVAAGQSIEDRLTAVTAFLTERGYNARWELYGDHYEIHTCNCPYIGVSDEHHELCFMDRSVVQSLVPDVVEHESRSPT